VETPEQYAMQILDRLGFLFGHDYVPGNAIDKAVKFTIEVFEDKDFEDLNGYNQSDSGWT